MKNAAPIVSKIKTAFIIKEFIFRKHRWCQHASVAIFQIAENRVKLETSSIDHVQKADLCNFDEQNGVVSHYAQEEKKTGFLYFNSEKF